MQCSTMPPSFLAVRHIACALQESWELPARAVCALASGRVFFSPTRRHPRRFRISNDLNFRKLVLLSWQSCARLNCSSSLITALMLCSSSNSQACAALVSSKGDATIEEMSHGQADTIRLQACYIVLSESVLVLSESKKRFVRIKSLLVVLMLLVSLSYNYIVH